ncbi:MAG: DUF1192 domain-containing protein [Acholeplasmatales bacterium]|jgi:hypothetical protein|nr:DUF1192 domain-containing protein [Acholeplasmatales bacterium]
MINQRYLIKILDKTYTYRELIDKVKYANVLKYVQANLNKRYFYLTWMRIEEVKPYLLEKVRAYIVASNEDNREEGIKLTYFNYFSYHILQQYLFLLDEDELDSYLDSEMSRLYDCINYNIDNVDFFKEIEALNSYEPYKISKDEHINNDITLNPIWADDLGYIDGISVDIFRPLAYVCYSEKDILDIGVRYGIEIPQELSKLDKIEFLISNYPPTSKFYARPETLDAYSKDLLPDLLYIPEEIHKLSKIERLQAEILRLEQEIISKEASKEDMYKFEYQYIDNTPPAPKKRSKIATLLFAILFTVLFLLAVLTIFYVISQYITTNFSSNLDSFLNKIKFGGKGFSIIIREFLNSIGIGE